MKNILIAASLLLLSACATQRAIVDDCHSLGHGKQDCRVVKILK